MARNTISHLPSGREWHRVSTGYLRNCGVSTPTYRADSWEVDWSRRDGKRVWARNPVSKMPSAKEWHWVHFKTIQDAGIPWRPKVVKTGRRVDANGYVVLTRRAMSAEDVTLAELHGLFRGRRRTFVREHQLVATRKYGALPPGSVVRHVNGIKTDNRPENLLLGTTQENTMDHNTARLQAMYWRERCQAAERKLAAV